MEKDNWFILGVAIGMIAAIITSTILWAACKLVPDQNRGIILLAFIIATPFASFIVKRFLGITKEY